MKLVKLELFGFKSFLHRTSFRFDDGITSIVGPNGCGKSNIVDAIVWALGERGTKTLRVKDMGDVIFHGSNGKRPVNIAEVSVELADSDRDYIISRRIYRDGVNEYLLNGSQVRLRDIQDFLLGTGIGLNSYAIVEQGRIEYFIQMKPQERRLVVEETSGITRFEEKKREAIARLEEVKTNLDRVDDIYGEATRSLEKASAELVRWKTHKALVERRSEIEAQILSDGYVKLTRRIDKIKDREIDLDREIAAMEEKKRVVRQELESKEREFALTDNILRQLEVDIKSMEKDMEARIIEMEYLGGEKKRFEEDREGLRGVVGELKGRIEKTREEVSSLREDVQAITKSLKEEEEETLQLQKVADELKEKITAGEKALEEQRTRLFVAMSEITDVKNRIIEIKRIMREREMRKVRKTEEQKRLKEHLAHLESLQKRLHETLNRAREERVILRTGEQKAFLIMEEKTAELEKKRRDMEILRGEKRGREEYLRQLKGVREERRIPLTGIKKLIDMVRVEEGREKALERFFFREMEYYVLPGDDMTAISQSVKRHGENFIFFPTKGMFSHGENEVEVGVTWVNDMDDALKRIDEGGEGIFINDDFLVDSRGFILQGEAAKKIDIRQFKERKRVENELKTIESRLWEAADALKSLESSHGEYNSLYRKAKADTKTKDESMRQVEKEIAVMDAEIRAARERLLELESDIDYADEIPPHAIEDLQKEKEGREKEKEERETVLKSHKTALDIVKKEHESSVALWHERKMDTERRKNRIKTHYDDIERKNNAIKGLSGDIGKNESAIHQLTEEADQRSVKIEVLEKSYEESKTMLERHVNRYEELKVLSGAIHMEQSTLSDNMNNISGEIEKTRSKREGLEKELAVLDEKKSVIHERLYTVYGIERPETVKVSGIAALEAEREKIVHEISQLGEVNFRAEKEYEELSQRLSFLEEQREDLNNSMNSLKKTIIRIDGLSREIFAETFDKVNEAFKRFANMLFKGGTGYLTFNGDTAGVDIYAQPAGKRVVRMELLSGGEKALVSLAFLLALMDTKPSPFSLLDEIDAPLDDANLASLMDIIKDISRKTQIIFITHNRITMESSDSIYGVTMEDEGISKVVSVRL